MIETAQKFFSRWIELANAFNPAITDLYADDCRIIYRQRQPDGQITAKEVNGKKMKALLKMVMTAAHARSDISFSASDLRFVEENESIRVTGIKHNPKKNTTGTFTALMRPDDHGRWWMIEEISES